MVTIAQSDSRHEVNNEIGGPDTSGRIPSPNSRTRSTPQLRSWLEPLLALPAGSLYGVLLAGTGLGFAIGVFPKTVPPASRDRPRIDLLIPVLPTFPQSI